MKGSVGISKGQHFVRWYNPEIKRDIKIYRYLGFKLDSERMAKKLLLAMQTDVEKGTFYLEKYKQQGFADTVVFIESWIDTIDGLSKATEKGYRSYIKNHIKPFFEKHNQISLPDIQIDILRKFRKTLQEKGLSPKMQWNIMFCVHAILGSAWESRRIPALPPFPKKKEYGFQEKVIKWLPSDRQINVLENIPVEHQPIFYFLKYHFRRPAEACALHKDDYSDGIFKINRSISAGELTGRTKTGEIHTIPCHPYFEKYLEIEKEKQIRAQVISKFLFINPMARKAGKRYTNESLNILWKTACKKAGETIDMYSGLKHSSCSQFINEQGGSESELQIITDHARIESVRNYAKTEVKRKKELMMKNIVKIDDVKKGII